METFVIAAMGFAAGVVAWVMRRHEAARDIRIEDIPTIFR
jgi:hypothetical protein